MPRPAPAARAPLPEERAYDKAKAAEEAWHLESWSLFVAAARRGDPSTAEAVAALDRYTTTPLTLADEAVPLHMMQVRVASAWRSNEEDDDAFEMSHQIAQARQDAFDARWAARQAAGLDPRTGESVAQVRKRQRDAEQEHRRSLPDEGHYPDLLSDAPNGCTRPDDDFLEVEGPIRHTRFNLGKHGSTHHLRYFDGDEAVAGITFDVGPRGAATIERVFTDPHHRRQGYAKALLDYAKGYFRSVKHSKDLTGMGKAWKSGVERLTVAPPTRRPTSQRFRDWFQNSVVVDRNGRPLPVYHGHSEHTPDFTVFDFNYAVDIGMHFGSKQAAESFGGTVRPYYLSIQNPIHLSDPGDWVAGVFNRMKNPALDDARQRGLISQRLYDDAVARITEIKRKAPSSSQNPEAFRAYRATVSRLLRETFEAAGYDGIAYENKVEDSGHTSYCAFHPEQIKSARTSGTFDPKNPSVEHLYGLPDRPSPPPLPPKVSALLAEASKLIGLPAKTEASDHNFRIQFDTKGPTFFRASTMGVSDWQIDLMPSDCREAWEEMGRPPVWIVQAIELSPDLREKGIGRLLYEALLHYAHSHGGIFGPNRCSGGVTSSDARRVWNSLARSYPTMGPFIVLD